MTMQEADSLYRDIDKLCLRVAMIHGDMKGGSGSTIVALILQQLDRTRSEVASLGAFAKA